MNILTKHLNRNNLKIPIEKLPPGTLCAFGGTKITEGVKLKHLIRKTFTDHYLIRYQSEYASIDIAMMMEAVIQGPKQLNALRVYSFYADKNKFLLLKRVDAIKFLLNITETPFVIGITFSNKKHIAYKAVENIDSDNFKIITDKGVVEFNKQKARVILSIMQKWYTIVPDKKETKALPTFFNKAHIEGVSSPNHKAIMLYGLQKYMNENSELEKYRRTPLFELLLWALNKK